ncbi:MAG: DUF4168 domain-containing protein [Kiloniellales bacterium]|nr:DUF4168 domain-containing protein [Kiloniellales bacterium]
MTELARRGLRAGVLAALLFLAGPLANAQAQGSFDDQKLEAFVVAVVKVDSLIDSWAPKIRSAESQEQAEAMNKQANAELRQAIEETDGITVDEYKAISDALSRDLDLMSRVEAIYKKQNGE